MHRGHSCVFAQEQKVFLHEVVAGAKQQRVDSYVTA